jgi:hypothetical protein
MFRLTVLPARPPSMPRYNGVQPFTIEASDQISHPIAAPTASLMRSLRKAGATSYRQHFLGTGHMCGRRRPGVADSHKFHGLVETQRPQWIVLTASHEHAPDA